MVWSIEDITKILGSEPYHIRGDPSRTFSGINAIDEASTDDFTFCSKKGEIGYELITNSKAKIVLTDISLADHDYRDQEKTLVFVNNPRLWYIKCLKSLFPIKKRSGIHPTAIIGKDCQIGEDIYIGPNTVIEDNVTIGKHTQIQNGVHIISGVKIGENVQIDSGCVIGGDGFGFERLENKELEKFPHYGSVVIHDNVELGANTCVDRGTLKNTIIGAGTKIDNLVHIAHNVKIGENCVIVCLSCIAGSVEIGDNSWVAPLAAIKNGLKIGKNSTVGMGAVVIRDVEDGDVVAGVPAKSLKK
jgi:UDP-3-O-[3-hydroxymyristoyl] glucosamine N-acyltransferase